LRLLLNGPPVALGGRTVTTFALIVHELATNAAKYGSLSVEQGSVHITWTCEGNALVMKWEEQDGPRLTGPPKSEGLGLCSPIIACAVFSKARFPATGMQAALLSSCQYLWND
jgi:two-component sensor histidine kinase